MARTQHNDLREACLQEAFGIIAERGVEALSLREVARRLGVSHQAPYRHFETREHMLAACVARAYAEFAQALRARPRRPDSADDLRAMGQAYFAYARRDPLKYRLMFGTPLPPPAEHPEMMRNAREAFALLQEGLGRLHGAGAPPDLVDIDALFVWAAIHGLATILQSDAANSLQLDARLTGAAEDLVLEKVSRGLGPPITR
jgi:AcrR family transcriptional regulator